MDTYSPYFGQIVTDVDLNSILHSCVDSITEFVSDFGYVGVAIAGDLSPNSTPNLSVNVLGPAVIYAPDSNRILIPTTTNCALAVDETAVSTAVVTNGNTKWLSVFVKFKRVDADPRIDEIGNTVYFKHVASYELHVVQGPEASANPLRAPLRVDQILLGDVKLAYGQTVIQLSDIDLSRQQTIFKIAGTPISFTGKGMQTAFQSLIAQLNAALGVINAGTITIGGVSGSPDSIGNGVTLQQAIIAIMGFINGLESKYNQLVIDLATTNTRIDEIPAQLPLTDYARLTPPNTFAGLQTVNNEVRANYINAGTGSNNDVRASRYVKGDQGLQSLTGGVDVEGLIKSRNAGLQVKDDVESTNGDVRAFNALIGKDVVATGQIGGRYLLIQDDSTLLGPVTLSASDALVSYWQVAGKYPFRSLTIPMNLLPTNPTRWARLGVGCICLDPAGDTAYLPLPKLPKGGSIASCNICYCAASDDFGLGLLQIGLLNYQPDWGVGHFLKIDGDFGIPLATGNPQGFAQTVDGTTHDDIGTIICNGSSGWPYSADAQIYIYFQCRQGDRINGARVNFYDPGLRSD